MYFTKPMLTSLPYISRNQFWNHFHVFHKIIAEITFMYFTKSILKTLSCFSLGQVAHKN
jgi:hypothetical protein